MNNFLRLKNISKYFNNEKKIKVLKNLSYDFNKGKMYALMGPSGSGKSTLLNLIGEKRAYLYALNLKKKILLKLKKHGKKAKDLKNLIEFILGRNF